MNRLKNMFLTVCCSFSLVIIINCLFSTLFVKGNQIFLKDIYMVLLTCIVVSFVINYIKFIENVFSSYIAMMIIVYIMQYLFYGNIVFTFINILTTVIIMSFIFFIIYLAIYYVNDKDAKKINSMINKRNS